MANPETVDILIIGSGMGGRPAPPVSRRPGLGSSSSSAALACAIAPVRVTPARFSSGASFGHRETWLDGAGQPFNPGNYYFNVRGGLGFDPTEPKHFAPYPHGPVPDERAIAKVR